MRRALAAVDRTTVELGEGTNTNVLACTASGGTGGVSARNEGTRRSRAARDGRTKVDVARDGSSTDVEPVLVVRRELLASAGLDDVDPDGDLKLACGAVRGASDNSSRVHGCSHCSRCIKRDQDVDERRARCNPASARGPSEEPRAPKPAA